MVEIKNSQCYYTQIPHLADAWDESVMMRDGKNYKKVLTGFSFIIEGQDSPISVSVHRGFLTNGSSIPAIIRSKVFEWLGVEHPAIVLHDWLTEYLLVEHDYFGRPISAHDARAIFIKALENSCLTKKQLLTIEIAMRFSSMFSNPNRPQIKPFKRYIEDRYYGTCN